MPKKTYTVSTRLQIQSPLVVYMKDYMNDYNKIKLGLSHKVSELKELQHKNAELAIKLLEGKL